MLQRRRSAAIFAARVFQAIQGHWLTACLGVLMDLKIPEILSSQQQAVEFKQVYITQLNERFMLTYASQIDRLVLALTLYLYTSNDSNWPCCSWPSWLA